MALRGIRTLSGDSAQSHKSEEDVNNSSIVARVSRVLQSHPMYRNILILILQCCAEGRQPHHCEDRQSCTQGPSVSHYFTLGLALLFWSRKVSNRVRKCFNRENSIGCSFSKPCVGRSVLGLEQEKISTKLLISRSASACSRLKALTSSSILTSRSSISRFSFTTCANWPCWVCRDVIRSLVWSLRQAVGGRWPREVLKVADLTGDRRDELSGEMDFDIPNDYGGNEN